MEKEKKFMIIGVFILLITLVGAAGTYAWFTWSSASNTNLTMSIGASSDVIFKNGNDISTNKLAPVFNYTDGEKTSFTIINKSTTSFSYRISLNITSIADELKNSTLKYKLVSNNTIITEGDFSDIGNVNVLYEGELSKGNVGFIFYLYIDGNEENNLNMVDKSLSGTITVEEVKETAVTMLSAKFKAAVKTQVTNNNVTYNYDTSNNLMEDVGGNLRYYGADPRNYIYFNCENYSNQTSSTCELWRIIGIFDGKMKIMRNENIGIIPFDNDAEDTYLQPITSDNNEKSLVIPLNYNNDYKNVFKQIAATEPIAGSGQNDYSKSSLQKILNNYYYNSLEYTGNSTYDFTSIGLKKDITRNMIATVTYSLGGYTNANIYANQMYSYERETTVYSGNVTTWTGKIAVAYASDYGYASDLSLCQKQLSSYSDATCTTNNWMRYNTKFLLLNTNSNTVNGMFSILDSGIVYEGSNVLIENNVLPTLYLLPELDIKSGSGTSSSPYQLSI